MDQELLLRSLVEGTSAETGQRFFASLVKNVAQALSVHGAWVTEYLREEKRLRALAFWLGNDWVNGYEYDISGSPCEIVVSENRPVHIPENVINLYPQDHDLKAFGAVSYLGIPLSDQEGRVFGHLAVLDNKPMPEDPRALAIFRIFASRAVAEMERLSAEKAMREREEKLNLLVNSALDAIIEFDQNFRILRFNPAAEKAFGASSAAVIDTIISSLVDRESWTKLEKLVEELAVRREGNRSMWIPGGLRAQGPPGLFPAEATLSMYALNGKNFFTLILRNVNERLEAERQIQSLQSETEYLQEEIRTLQNFSEIIGRSEKLLSVLKEVHEVADTDATVLIFGETGTGKELIARAIHAISKRKQKPMIKVNCAAIPSSLMESEFFGHERGAFTGAIGKREGRFTLADRGTLFLDEIGELPLELQVKLLRVLQEGEFEPVGSAVTKRVDVRVIAATNRDLLKQTAEGKFRQDLYFRLNVFPIRIPPLRERLEDIPMLASNFVTKFAQKIGRPPVRITEASIRGLQSYDWPGNVRELENVIERAVILSTTGTLNLDRAFPEVSTAQHTTASNSPETIMTAEEVNEMERANIMRALNSSGWKVSGKNGAADILGMNASTLSSRIKALRIKRPTE
ncbi:MAG: Fis family transcriptional regulator [Acidobacteria bacterium]|nr:MAG: Fis family transcriptional regulator [Acidobacteriota bacterium]